MKNIITSALVTAVFLTTFNVFAAPNWKRINYQQSTIFTGIVTVDGQPAQAGDIVGIFVQGECRMVSTVFIQDGNAYVSAVLHGDRVETATVQYWSATDDNIYNADSTITTKPDSCILQFPIRLKSSNETTGVKVISSSDIKLYPCPIGTELHISTTKEIETVTFYNNIGAVVLSVSNPKQNQICTASLCSGIYFVAITCKNGETKTQKIIKN